MAPHEDGAVTTVAEAYLSVLSDRGVSRLFVNAGTDFAPFVEAYARQKQSGLDLPELVVCAHENLAISMAHGAYLGDGRLQAVMVHTSVGTANAVCGAFNAATDGVPILLAAGRTPLFEDSVLGSRDGGIHWAQEMYDQASMVREFVKWDYELRDGVQVAAVLDRAIDIAMTAPRAPVYLTLPREVLARDASGAVPPRTSAVPTDAAPDPEAVGRLADLLAGARFPVFVTAASGAEPGTAALLGQLCDEYSIGVLESRPRRYNVSTDHPLHVGYDLGAVAEDADVLCFLDMDVPWIPASATPRADAVVVQCGPDPQFSRYPVRTHRSDLSVTASTGNLLAALAAALPGRSDRIDRGRRTAIEAAAAASRARVSERLAAAGRADGPITKAFMNWALAQVLAEDASVVSEYWARPDLLPLRGPLSYFGTPPRRPRVGAARGHRPEAGQAGANRYLRRGRRRLPVRQPGRVPPRDGDARPPGADGRLREPQVDGGPGLGARRVPGGARRGRRPAQPAGRARPRGRVRAVRGGLRRLRRGRHRAR